KLLQRGEQLKTEPDQVHQRIELLGKHVECPLCGQLLGEEGLAAAQARLRAQLEELDVQLQQTRVQWAKQREVVRGVENKHKTLEEQLAARANVQRNLGGIMGLLQRADQDRAILKVPQ